MISQLVVGGVVPRLRETRVLELLSIGPSGLLWLAEADKGREKLLIAEYEPKSGGRAKLREFNTWYQGLKALPAGLLPEIQQRFSHDERLFLVLNAGGWQSLQKASSLGNKVGQSTDFLAHLLKSIETFSRATGVSAHGWIRAETVAMSNDGPVLGPPHFDPSVALTPDSDLRQCALVTCQCLGLSVGTDGASPELLAQLSKSDDWRLATTLEWMLSDANRRPASVSAALTFLDHIAAVPAGGSEPELVATVDALKQLYDRSGSSILNTKIERAEIELERVRKSKRRVPPPRSEPKPSPSKTDADETQHPQVSASASTLEPPPVAQVVELEPQFEPELQPEIDQSTPPRRKPSKQAKRSGWFETLTGAAVLTAAVVGIWYYVSQAPVREFDSYWNRQVLFSASGASAYSVYQNAVREKGPESSVVNTMNAKALPILQQMSKEAFTIWERDSELTRPTGTSTAAPGVTSWGDMTQLQEWLNAIERTPQSAAQLSYAQGMVALTSRQWDEAGRRFDDALRQQPNWSLALNGMGRTYFGRRQYGPTENYYKKAIEANPNWHFPHANLGTLYRDVIKDYAASEREYRTAIQLDPNRASFHFNLGLLFFIKGRAFYPSACQEFRTALSLTGRSLTPEEVATATRRRDVACQGL